MRVRRGLDQPSPAFLALLSCCLPQDTSEEGDESLLQTALTLDDGRHSWVGATRKGSVPHAGWQWVDRTASNNLNVVEGGLWQEAPSAINNTAAQLWESGLGTASPSVNSTVLCQLKWSCPPGHSCGTLGVKVGSSRHVLPWHPPPSVAAPLHVTRTQPHLAPCPSPSLS